MSYDEENADHNFIRSYIVYRYWYRGLFSQKVLAISVHLLFRQNERMFL